MTTFERKVEEYKKELSKKMYQEYKRSYEAIKDLGKAWVALSDVFYEEEETDSYDYLCDDYPFQLSFEEMTHDVMTWIYTTQSKLEQLMNSITSQNERSNDNEK